MKAATLLVGPLLCLSVAACTASAGMSAAGTVAPSQLDGHSFLSTSIQGRALVTGTRVRIGFDAGSLTANADCNTMSGKYTVSGGQLAVTELATTEMGCASALSAQDQWLATLLGGAAITLAGSTLTLETSGVTLTLLDRVVADPDRPLVGTSWVLDSIGSGQTMSSVPVGVVASIVFEAGAVQVRAGCNGGSGPATIGPSTISFGSIAMTQVACSPDATSVESALTAVLRGEVAWSIRADALTLVQGANQLVFRAEGQPTASA